MRPGEGALRREPPAQSEAAPSLDASEVQQSIHDAYRFAQHLNDQYVEPQSDATRAADLAKYSDVQRQLAGLVASDRLPPAPTGVPDYAQQAYRASYFLLTAAATAGLVDAKLPEAVTRGSLRAPDGFKKTPR